MRKGRSRFFIRRLNLHVGDQVLYPQLKRVSEPNYVGDRDIPLPAFDAADVRPVKVGLLRELFLCQAQGEPALADGLTEGNSRIGGHPPMFSLDPLGVHRL